MIMLIVLQQSHINSLVPSKTTKDKMETIFDFNPTKSEIDRYGFGSKERYMRFINKDGSNQSLAYMLYCRGDERYKHYAELLPTELKNNFYHTIEHP